MQKRTIDLYWEKKLHINGKPIMILNKLNESEKKMKLNGGAKIWKIDDFSVIALNKKNAVKKIFKSFHNLTVANFMELAQKNIISWNLSLKLSKIKNDEQLKKIIEENIKNYE